MKYQLNFIEYFSVKIDPNFVNIPVRNYTQFLVDNNIEIQGETSGVRATVVNRITSNESIDDFDTLYVKYNKSSRLFDAISQTTVRGSNLSSQSSSLDPATVYHLDSGAIYRSGWEGSHIKIINDAVMQVVSVFAIGS